MTCPIKLERHWQDDPALATACAEAREWGQHFWAGRRGY